MGGDATASVQKAIFRTLTEDPELMNQLGGGDSVRDYMAQDVPYPWIFVGDDVATDAGSKSAPGMEIVHSIHSFTRDRGRLKLRAIMARIYDLLHEQPMTLDESVATFCRFESQNTLMDSDGVTRHGVQRFRIRTTAS